MRSIPFTKRERPTKKPLNLSQSITKLAVLILIAQATRLHTLCTLLVQRGQLPQPCHRSRHKLNRELNIFRRILLAQAEADARTRALRTKAHSTEHVRRLDRSRGTRRAGRNRQALEIQRNDQRLTFDVVEINIRRIRHPWRPIAV